MPEQKRRAVPSGPYRHLVGGEADGRSHEVGDRVDPSTPERKVAEWLRAGIIELDVGKEKHAKQQRQSA
jgi:hypothetical protein